MRAASSRQTVASGNGAKASEAAVASRADEQRQPSLPRADRVRTGARKLERPLPDLFVVGGQQQALRPLHAGVQPWYRYRKGVVLHVRTAEETVETALEYASPPDVCAPDNPAILFKQGTLADGKLYLCTQTEVMVYSVPGMERLHYVSLPSFHDVHHVRPTPEGTLLVANTGLDMVMEVTLAGEVLREWSVLGTDIWARFSASVDYRLVPSMKPHRSHPNHVFYVGRDIWVTRFEQRDAICLTDPDKRIDIGLERVHDGVSADGRLYFSTVDGKIVIVDEKTLEVEEVHDLNRMGAPGELLGWCRGLHVEGSRVWVGFSRLRPTRFRENVSWVVNGFRKILPTRIGCYDLERKVCVREIDLEPYGMNAVFSLHAAGG